jgi:transcription antitermination factor NusG
LPRLPFSATRIRPRSNNPGHDRLAAESVAQAGFETFTPKIRTRVDSRWRTTPLLGVYFFARIVDRWRILERTIGVHSVVKFGAAPARCPDEEIAKLIARADPDGIVRLSRPPLQPARRILAPGAGVAIADGPFRGVEAIDPAIDAAIKNNLALAEALKISGTPTWVTSKRITPGLVGLDILKQMIAEARKG